MTPMTQNNSIDIGRECILKGLCVYLNEDPEKLVKEYMADDVRQDTAMKETVFGIYVVRHEVCCSETPPPRSAPPPGWIKTFLRNDVSIHPDHPPSESTISTHSPRYYQDIMTFLSIYLILCALYVSLHSGESVNSVSGDLGSTAVLPCELKSVGTEPLYIKWKNKDEIVFERNGTVVQYGEGYEGRVDVPEEELRKGNCSLVLHNLTLNDSGDYTSIQTVKRFKRALYSEEISRVSLSVREKPPEEKSDEVSSPTVLI
ncbi:hypothetical protein C0J45_13817 [Silurus meridionalis]|nr:hypothetical protein C0J45_13817 [Silurus meridionalis]